MEATTARSGRKPGAKTYPAAFVASAGGSLAPHFRALDAALADFKKETAADRRLERSIRGKTSVELERLVTEADKRAALLRAALKASKSN